MMIMNELTKILISIEEKTGLDPIYFSTLLIICAHLLFDFRKYRNWNKINTGQRFYTIITLIAVIFFILLSLLHFFNVIK